MMNIAGPSQKGLLVLLMGVAWGTVGTSFAQPMAPVPPPATAPADAAATKPAAMPKVEDLLPGKKATFSFSDKPIKDVLAYIGESYDLKVVNTFEKTDAATMNLQITMKLPEPLSARQAITLLNDTLVALGYSAVPTVKGDPPQVVLTVIQIARDGPKVAPIFYGGDPDKIPLGEEIRTQVITLKNLDPAAVKEAISPVLGKRADITLNSTAKTIIVTDTAAHIHTAAALIEVLEKQAGNNKPAPAVEKKE